MRFKHEGLRDEFHRADTHIQVVAEWFDQLCQAHFAQEAIITRVFEDIPGATGVHPAGRAVDIRNECDGKHLFSPEAVMFLVSEMNRRFHRNDGKLTCIHHSFNGGPEHFHLQVPYSNKGAQNGKNEG